MLMPRVTWETCQPLRISLILHLPHAAYPTERIPPKTTPRHPLYHQHISVSHTSESHTTYHRCQYHVYKAPAANHPSSYFVRNEKNSRSFFCGFCPTAATAGTTVAMLFSCCSRCICCEIEAQRCGQREKAMQSYMTVEVSTELVTDSSPAD